MLLNSYITFTWYVYQQYIGHHYTLYIVIFSKQQTAKITICTDLIQEPSFRVVIFSLQNNGDVIEQNLIHINNQQDQLYHVMCTKQFTYEHDVTEVKVKYANRLNR